MPYTTYIHIGRPKTGTSAIQAFLRDSYDNLLLHGVLVPKTHRNRYGGHHSIFFDILEGNISTLRDIYAEIDSSCANTAILSCDHFSMSSNSSLATLKKGTLHPTKILVYLRDQRDMLVSSYNQSLKGYNGEKPTCVKSLEDYIHRLPVTGPNFSEGNYLTFLDRWSSHFGRENIIVRAYDKKLMPKGDVVRDFHEVLEIPMPLPKRIKRVNLRLSGIALEISRRLSFFPIKNRKRLIHSIKTLLGGDERNDCHFQHNIMTPHLDKLLIERYQDINNQVRKKYPIQNEALNMVPREKEIRIIKRIPLDAQEKVQPLIEEYWTNPYPVEVLFKSEGQLTS